MPDEGVLVVSEFFDAQYGHPPKRCGARLAGLDYYWMTIQGMIQGGSPRYTPGGVYIKRGKEVDAETWDRIYNAACVDPDYGINI